MDFKIQFLLFTLFVSAYSDIVTFKTCPGENESLNCEISQLRVTPCPEASGNKPCHLKKGKIANIEFDYVGKANLDGLTTKAYWTTPAADLPLVGMDDDGCAHTQCPTTANQQTFKYDLNLSAKFPSRNYNVKWKLFKESEMDCCLIFKIKLD